MRQPGQLEGSTSHHAKPTLAEQYQVPSLIYLKFEVM
jgi:hypothetical protein